MTIVETLLEFQQSCIKADECKKLIKEDSKINSLKKLKTEFEKDKEKYQSKNKLLKEINKEYVIINNDIINIKEEIKTNENILYNELGSDVRGIEILQRKLEELKSSIKDLEDKSLEVLVKEEKCSNDIKTIRSDLNKIKDDFNKIKENSDTNLREKKEQLIKTEQTVDDLKQNIPKKYLDIYMKIEHRRGSAVAKLQGDVCSGCKLKISTMTKDRIKRDDIVYCDNCGRILYDDKNNKS